ncbi:MAG: hypothetical protein ACNS63_08345 [Candidatus Nitrospinota bacterium M3_3B_026]
MKLARALLGGNMMTEDQFEDFLGLRERFDQGGKRYLGDIMVERGYISQDVVDEFFAQNNEMYLEFLDELIETGFLREDQKERILADEGSRTKVVSVLEKLGIMTKESFIKLFSKRVNSLRLGDWLLAKRKIDKETLEKALKEQNIYRLEDYLRFHEIIDEARLAKIKEKLGIA